MPDATVLPPLEVIGPDLVQRQVAERRQPMDGVDGGGAPEKAPAGLAARARVTAALLLVTTLPYLSSTATVTAGLMLWPAPTLVGWLTKAELDGVAVLRHGELASETAVARREQGAIRRLVTIRGSFSTAPRSIFPFETRPGSRPDRQRGRRGGWPALELRRGQGDVVDPNLVDEAVERSAAAVARADLQRSRVRHQRTVGGP